MNTRRNFLKTLATAPALGAAPVAFAQSASAPQTTAASRKSPRRIIFLVADGMSAGTMTCADHLSRQLRGRGLTFLQLTGHPGVQAGFMDMQSQDSLVTDSAAASSSWGCGVRIPNGKVNRGAAGEKFTPLYELLKSEGWARGLVTTTEITHATPAGFAACTESRNHADEIAAQYLEHKVEVLLGGGRKYFEAERRGDKRDLKGDFAQADYAVLESPNDLDAAPVGRPWLGLFAGGHLPYLVDQAGGVIQPPETPTLAAMTRRALQKLGRSERFILQVEGGRVDHGCHANDAAAAFREMIGFDEAIDVVMEFVAENPGTLVVITTDHGNANPALNGMGVNYRGSTPLFRNVAKMKLSTGAIIDGVKRAESTDAKIAFLKEATGGYEVSPYQLGQLEPYLAGAGEPLFGGLNSAVGALGAILGNYTGVSFTSTNHTSDHVPVLALGPGAEAFRGFIENTVVFDRFMDFAGINFRNKPRETARLAPIRPRNMERVEEYLHV